MIRPVITVYVPHNTAERALADTRKNLVSAFARTLKYQKGDCVVVEEESDLIVLFLPVHRTSSELNVVAEIVMPTFLDFDPPTTELQAEVLRALKSMFGHTRIQCSIRLQEEASFATYLNERRKKAA